VLRQNQVKLCRARGSGNHALQEERISEVFEIAQLRVTSHRPFTKLMQMDAEFLRHVSGVGNLRTKDVDLVATPDHFLDQINRLRRTTSGRRKERFVRQKGDAQ